MLETLNCNSCGAPLEVPESANFVRCNHCGQSLAIRRSDSTTFTEAIDKLAEQTANLSEQVRQLETQNALEQLSRSWELEQQRFMLTDKHGRQRMPTEGTAVAGGVVAAVFGLIWIAVATGITSSASEAGAFGAMRYIFPLFGIVFIGVGIGVALVSFNKAKDYRVAKRRYLRRRSEIRHGNGSRSNSGSDLPRIDS